MFIFSVSELVCRPPRRPDREPISYWWRRELTQPPPPTPLAWTSIFSDMDWWEDNKRTSSCSLGPEPHHSILQPVKVRLFISKDQHISLLQAPTQFLSPIFSLSPLSIHLSLSYSLANGKTVLGWILFFKGINSPLYTLDLTPWQALSVSSAWYRASCSVCWWTQPIIEHKCKHTLSRTHSKSALAHISMHVDTRTCILSAQIQYIQIHKNMVTVACEQMCRE